VAQWERVEFASCAHGARSSPRAGRWPHRAAPHRGAGGPAPVWLSAGSCAHAVATPLTGRGSRHHAGRVVRSSGRVASILCLRGVSREGWSPFLHTLSESVTTLKTGLLWYRQSGQARPQLPHPSPTWPCARQRPHVSARPGAALGEPPASSHLSCVLPAAGPLPLPGCAATTPQSGMEVPGAARPVVDTLGDPCWCTRPGTAIDLVRARLSSA